MIGVFKCFLVPVSTLGQRSFLVLFQYTDSSVFFAGDERKVSWGYLAASVFLALVNTLVLVQISYAQRNFQTALSGKDEGKGQFHQFESCDHCARVSLDGH